MSEQLEKSFEERSRTLFQDSVENVDMRIRSRLTQARHAALEAQGLPLPSRFKRFGWWTPAAGVTAAAVLGVALWMGGQHGVSSQDARSNFEDLDIVAAVDDSAPDALDMLQDDIDFYDFADKSAGGDPAA
jgi:negative regulator of sigma E activity